MKRIAIIITTLFSFVVAAAAEPDWEKIAESCNRLDSDFVSDIINIGFTKESPRQILEEDYYTLLKDSVWGGNLPISGGWGYTQEDSVIINKDDPSVIQSMPFDGIGLEYFFIEHRIYEELITFRPRGEGLRAIRWKQLIQQVRQNGQRYFDYHRYFVFGFREKDLEYRKKIYTDNNGFKDDPEGLERHREEDYRVVTCYETDYWFDITSFYRK